MHRTRLLEEWLELSSRDPDLPASLLPADWPRARARDAFLAIHQDLGALATTHVRALVATVDVALAAQVEQRTTADWTSAQPELPAAQPRTAAALPRARG